VTTDVTLLGAQNPGSSRQYTPVCFLGWKHQFQHVPDFIAPERHGTITGNVFRDDQSKGTFGPDMKPMAEVEVTLDDRRREFTHPDGSYRFSSVPLTLGKAYPESL
jgi:hypothetical protein